MPRKVDALTAYDKRWNFYVNEIEKSEFMIELAKAGKSRCQSAAMRAFMFLYAHDQEVQDKVNKIIDDFIVYKENGKISQM